MKRQRNYEKEDKPRERLMPATGEESRQSIREGAGNIVSIQKMTRGRNLRWLQPWAATSGYRGQESCPSQSQITLAAMI